MSDKKDYKKQNAEAYESMLAPVEFEVEGSLVKLNPSIVKDYITGGKSVTMQEYKMFTELCKARKLNPFLKEAYLIKYTDTSPAQVVVGKDAILKRAVLHRQFNGRKQGIIVLRKDEIVYLKGTFKLPSDELVGGWATVYRKDWEHPVEVTVSFDESAQKKGNGELNQQWETKGATMIEKVALVRALREAFVEDLAGLYDQDETWKDINDTPPIINQDEPNMKEPEEVNVVDVNPKEVKKEKNLSDI